MLDSYPVRASLLELNIDTVRFVGGTEAATKVYGPGVSVEWTSTGVYTLTWDENPGTYIGFTHGFQATTAADLAGYTVVAGVYDADAFTLAVTVSDSLFAATDLAALEWLTLDVKFSRSGAL